MATCPRCGGKQFIRRGSRKRPDRVQCKDCNKFYQNKEGVKLLAIDIETLPMVYYTWGTWGVDLRRAQMIQDWCLLSFSAKWIGEDRIISSVLTPTEALARDDKRISKIIWDLLDQAHTVVTHNGRRFDIRKINTRFWKHKLHKPSSYKIIDTLVTAKEVFGLTYNNMDFIAEFIEADQKLHTNQELWNKCDIGDESALAEMLEYNDQDVRTQEQIYLEMREWIPNHPNLALFVNRVDACPVCLHTGYKPIGVYVANKKRYQEFRCTSCHSTWHGSKALK